MSPKEKKPPNVTGKTVYSLRVEDDPTRKRVVIAFTDGSELTVGAATTFEVALLPPKILTDIERKMMNVGRSLTTDQMPSLIGALQPSQMILLTEVLRSLMDMSRREQ